MRVLAADLELPLQPREPALHEVQVLGQDPAALLGLRWVRGGEDSLPRTSGAPRRRRSLRVRRGGVEGRLAGRRRGAIFSIIASAGASWPWPMEMLMKLFFAVVNPNFSPISSIQTVGSTPGKSTKKMGVEGEDSE